MVIGSYPDTISYRAVFADSQLTFETIQGWDRVCLLMEAGRGYEIYRRGFTDSSGEFSTYLDPSVAGSMSVTLTRQGYLPDEGEVRLVVE